jgi:hypothetical protein
MVTYIPVRISGTEETGIQVWELGRYHSLVAARNERNDQIEKDAEHLIHHSGPRGYVGIAPTGFLGMAVTLHAADGTVECQRIFEIYSCTSRIASG